MASFTETATLKVVDESSAQIKAINRALRALFKTANSLKSASASIDIKTKGLAQASAMVKALSRDLKGLKSGGAIPIKVTGLAGAQAQINRVRQQAQKPVIMKLLGAAAGIYGLSGAARAVGRQAIAGTKQADIGTVNLDQLQLGEARRKEADKQIKETEDRLKALPGPYQFNTGLVQQRMAENLREVREGEAAKALRVPVDPAKPWFTRAATAAEMQAASQKRMRVAAERTYQEMISADQIAKDTGVSAASAVEKIKGYYKALDMAGYLADESGDNTIEQIQKGGDFVRRLRGAIGEEATGEFLRTLVKREKSGKFALTDKGQLGVAFIAEDMGPAAAGTAFSTWINSVTGSRVSVAARRAQVAAGLAENPRYEGTGKNKRYVADTIDSGLAQTDPLKYARERMVPALQKMGMTNQQIFSNDPKDIAVMSDNLRKLNSETNAANFAITMMTRLIELEGKTRDAYTRDATPTVMAEATKNSVQAAANAIQTSFQGIFGQAAVAIAPYAAPIADSISTMMSDVATNVQLAGKGDPQAIAKLAAGAVGAGVVGGAAFAAVRAIAGPLAMVGGVQAMVSKDPTVAALGAATVAMSASANAQNTAAAAMVGGWGKLAALLGTVGTGLGIPAALAYTEGPWSPEGRAGKAAEDANLNEAYDIYRVHQAKETLKKAQAALEQLDKGQLLLPPPPDMYIGKDKKKTAEQKEKNKLYLAEQRAQMVEYIAGLERKIAEYEAAKPPVEPPKVEPPTVTADAARAEAEAARAKADAEAEAAKNRSPSQQAAVDEAAKAEAEAKAAIAAATSPSAETAKIEAAKARAAAAKQEAAALAAKTETIEKTPVAAAASAEGAKPVDPLATLIPQLAASSNSIQLAATTLSASTGLFAAAFSTGAQQIAAAGQTAASTISAGAASAGAAYGAAAAAAIQAAVANVNVNVNVKGGSADQGNINNANGNK